MLLVEDNPDHADLIGDSLEDAGHEVVRVADAASARQAVSEGGHDLMLLDYTLGAETGFDVLRHVQQVAPSLPVVVLTGRDDEELVIEAMQLGAADFLVKSFDRSFMRVLPLYVSKNLERSRLALALVDSEAARERSEAYLRLVMDSLDAVVVGVDEMFRVTDTNAAWAGLVQRLGAAQRDPIGCRLDELFTKGPLTALLNEQRTDLALGEASVLRGAAATAGPSGDQLELEVEATPLVAADRGEGVVFVLTDVTERNRARREEAALSARLAQANEELDRLAKARGALVTGVSKELRSPAQSIGGFARMLSSGSLGALSDKAVQAAEVVGRGAARLGRLAEDLDYLANNPGDPHPPIVLVDLVTEALEVGADDRRGRKIRIRREFPELPSEVLADRSRLVGAIALLIADVANDARDRSALLLGMDPDPGAGEIHLTIEADGAAGGSPTDLRMEVAIETIRRHGGRLVAVLPDDPQSRGGWRLTLPSVSIIDEVAASAP